MLEIAFPNKCINYLNKLAINSTSNSFIGNINPFRYKGYYYDTETKMYYCRSRYYVPEWCRWLNGDHVGYLDLEDIDGMNLFAYCGNNPITYIDEDGNFLGMGFGIAIGLAALFAAATAATVVATEVSKNIDVNIDGEIRSSRNFVTGLITDTLITSIPYIGSIGLDNVRMSKKNEESEHTKNARSSTREKHQYGKARRQRDKRGEKGDKHRTRKDKWYTIPKNNNQKKLSKIANSIAKYY